MERGEGMYTVNVTLTKRQLRIHRSAHVWKLAARELYAEARKAGAKIYKTPPLPYPQCVIDAWIAFYRSAPYRCVLQYDIIDGAIGCVTVLFDTEGFKQ